MDNIKNTSAIPDDQLHKWVEIDAEVIHETPKAVLILFPYGGDEVWIPKTHYRQGEIIEDHGHIRTRQGVQYITKRMAAIKDLWGSMNRRSAW